MNETKSEKTNLTTSLLPGLGHIIVNAGNLHNGVYDQLGLEMKQSVLAKQEKLNAH
jgi:hypothetical protein